MEKEEKQEIKDIVVKTMLEMKKQETEENISAIKNKFKETDWIDKIVQGVVTTGTIELTNAVKRFIGNRE